MKKRLTSLLKYGFLGITVFSLVVLSGCKSDEKGPSIFNGTVLALMQSDQFKAANISGSEQEKADKGLDSLNKYLGLYPDLAQLLTLSPSVTLFAPSNSAFISLLGTPGFPQRIADISPSLIKGVLAYHIISDKLLKADLTPTGSGDGLMTNFAYPDPCGGASVDQKIKINSDGTLLTGSTNTAIEIITADQQATNGVLHVVSAVLIPPAVGAALTPILGTITATIALGADFSILARVMTKADCGAAPSASESIYAILASTGPYTAFLPPDAVFEGTAAAQEITVDQLIGAYSAEQWRAIILHHVISGSKEISDFENNSNLSSLNSHNIHITLVTPSEQVPTGVLLGTEATSNSPILVGDIVHSNGVAHVVGKILF